MPNVGVRVGGDKTCLSEFDVWQADAAQRIAVSIPRDTGLKAVDWIDLPGRGSIQETVGRRLDPESDPFVTGHEQRAHDGPVINRVTTRFDATQLWVIGAMSRSRHLINTSLGQCRNTAEVPRGKDDGVGLA